ncbi:YdeI/OmpD-associated family protein [Microbacterium sp. zg.Y1090]|uniref:YdeI/OmpD-associated family protein n=1 Tax=Microbacterium TaxID=33882 RepID=UPI00214B9959|nr:MULTISPECIES: YdeI/OmpD-associated family protein [unclassified Microbacterium]MCR2813208.1 YdeI/OmpD-associated family protein [Microbacterium sp. zg.Y1084]MCR2819521.1 YdeI/OmpD-associated family protein [Microbacterium sp. zg.Y1090]MDL5487375.1 YdeI/OmpD-associated family protein [Microbacterium sp. zg-Y1211]WIM28492.1 YdeI/OmpD-associated family protein [Microbacterium sp. zg-Y1090]
MGVHDDAEALRATDAAAWRAWLEEHHATARGVWLLRPRAGVVRELVGYDDAVRQALCFGWIDGTVRPHDDETIGQWYSPRRPGSGWAATNKARVAQLEASGEMAEAGRRVVAEAKASGAWELLDGPEAGIEPPELTAALDAVPQARANWDAFPASARKMGLTAVAMAKRPETKTMRIAKIVADAAEGRRP